MTTSQLERIAYHEAGHAVMAHYLCTGLESVTIDSDHESAGHMLSVDENDEDVEALYLAAEEAFWQRKAIVMYAGAEAVRHKWPTSRWGRGADNDYRWAAIALEKITGDEQALHALQAYALRAARLNVAQYWLAIEQVAQALLKAGTLDAKGVRAVIHASKVVA
jgi:hypothetical protein